MLATLTCLNPRSLPAPPDGLPSRCTPPPLALMHSHLLLSLLQPLLACSGDTAGERVVTKSGMVMRVIPPGSFTMGCTPGAGECFTDEKPTQAVILTVPFLLGETEVTQGQWQAVMGSNPSHFASCGPDCPVEQVSWLDAVAFANALSETEGLESCYRVSGEAVTWPRGLACTGYRLPTEAEWEHAARAGGDTTYAGSADIAAVVWYRDTSERTPHPVGGKRANAWGLHDMNGNVWEWTWDAFQPFSGGGTVTDPIGPETGLERSIRGGGFGDGSRVVRLVFRRRFSPGGRGFDLGLRLARTKH